MLDGTPVSVFADPFRVGVLEAVDGATGLRPDAPAPSRKVDGTGTGRVDQIAAQSISDIEAFWETRYSDTFDGEFRPVKELISWNAERLGGQFCDDPSFLLINATYCYLDDTIGWDRRDTAAGVAQHLRRHGHHDGARPRIRPRHRLECQDHQASSHPDAGGRTAGRLSGRRLSALGGRGHRLNRPT
jgi:hypothetical protein